MTQTSLAALTDIVRRFYPSGLGPWDERYVETPEYLRAREAWHRALRADESWQRVLSLLRERAVPGFRIRDLTVPYMHPSWRVALLVEGTPFIAVGCVSVLAPIFFCHGLEGLGHDPEVLLRDLPREVSRGLSMLEGVIREVFPYERLSPEDALTVVPGVELEHCPPGGATLLAALISNDLSHYV